MYARLFAAGTKPGLAARAASYASFALSISLCSCRQESQEHEGLGIFRVELYRLVQFGRCLVIFFRDTVDLGQIQVDAASPGSISIAF